MEHHCIQISAPLCAVSDILFNTILETAASNKMHKALHTCSYYLLVCIHLYVVHSILMDDSNIEQALQKVQEPSCVPDPPRSLCTGGAAGPWGSSQSQSTPSKDRSSSLHCKTQPADVLWALIHASYFEIIFIYECLCYSYKYLNCIS